MPRDILVGDDRGFRPRLQRGDAAPDRGEKAASDDDLVSALAERTGAINLGQGFPDEDGPPELLEAAQKAIRDGHNQYAPLPGVPALREAIAEHQARFYGIDVDPATEVQVTFGATEAIAAALLGICEPGDDVVCFEPYYDSYAAGIAMAGARRSPSSARRSTPCAASSRRSSGLTTADAPRSPDHACSSPSPAWSVSASPR